MTISFTSAPAAVSAVFKICCLSAHYSAEVKTADYWWVCVHVSVFHHTSSGSWNGTIQHFWNLGDMKRTGPYFECNDFNQGCIISGGRCTMHNEYKTVVARWWIALITCEHLFYYYIFCVCYYPKHKHGPTLMIRKCRRLLRARQSSKQIYCWSKCSEQFKIRWSNWNRIHFMLEEKG